jgi:hypothetical protein
MTIRLLATLLTLAAAPLAAQTTQPAPPRRAIRRDIPLTNGIRRALATGTRDSTGRPGRNYWQLSTDYAIDARLDQATSTVSGTERVVIHNASDSALRTIVLRLDQNLFRPDAVRAEAMTGIEITDGMRVTRLAVDGQTVTATGLTTTVATVRLPNAIAPKGSATLEAAWSFKVPDVGGGFSERMGRWADSLYQVAQWYPRVAVYDDLRGWDTDPYLGPSEFYTNFGRFDVRLDVPAGWLVGATGVLQNAEQVLAPAARERLSHALDSDSTRNVVRAGERGTLGALRSAQGDSGRLVWHFVADSVADFAWATSDRFVYDVTRATIPGKGAVPVHILYVPGHAAQYAAAGPTVRHALEFYSRLWMPYAFPQLTVVDGPEHGMEYPMFIMSSVGASDHETGHQWWPMMVGVNETWYGFMDEGFNQYMNRLSRFDRQGKPPSLDSLGQSYGETSGDEREAPLMWDANYGGPLYSFQAYGKAPLMLSALGGVVGDSAVWRAMSTYAKAWRFKHPSPWDWAFSMQNALGRDLGWFWYYWLFTTASVDGSIARATTVTGGRTTVTVRQDGDMPSPVVLEVKFTPGGPPLRPMPNARMLDANTAEVTWPVDVWFDGRRTFDAVLDFGPRNIERLTLDPHGRFPDRNPDDNVWPRAGVP